MRGYLGRNPQQSTEWTPPLDSLWEFGLALACNLCSNKTGSCRNKGAKVEFVRLKGQTTQWKCLASPLPGHPGNSTAPGNNQGTFNTQEAADVLGLFMFYSRERSFSVWYAHTNIYTTKCSPRAKRSVYRAHLSWLRLITTATTFNVTHFAFCVWHFTYWSQTEVFMDAPKQIRRRNIHRKTKCRRGKRTVTTKTDLKLHWLQMFW